MINSTITAAYNYFRQKDYDKSLFYYTLFQKRNKEIATYVELNKKIINKRKENSSKLEYVVLAENKTQSPKISIIIPVFNTEAYLEKCLDSVVNQTFDNFEVICIDDGSSDTSIDILLRYAETDKRFTVVAQDNKFAGVARNVGIELSRGEYFLFLDSDDFFSLNLCEILYKNALKNNSDIVVCDAYLYDNKTASAVKPAWSLKSSLLPTSDFFAPAAIADYIFNFTNNWPWNKLIKKELVSSHKLHFQDIRHTNDTYFICMCMALANKISCVNDRLIYYRINVEKSLTTSHSRNLSKMDIFTCLDGIFENLKKENIFNNYKKSFFHLCIQQLYWNYYKLTENDAKALFVNEIVKRNFYGISVSLDESYFNEKDVYTKYLNIISLFSQEDYIFLYAINSTNCSVVSFDIFDTLITRYYSHPSDIFRDIEVANKAYGFCQARIAAEKKARITNGDKEVTLDEIYSYLSSEFVFLQEKEIEKELEAVLPNEKLIEVLNSLIQNGKTVILTSDMYLDESVIVNMLKKCRISGYKALYLSSTYGVTKKSGKLFKSIMEKMNIASEDILHVGDNEYSDVVVPQKNNINSIRYTQLLSLNKEIVLYQKDDLNQELVQSFISKISLVESRKKTSTYWKNIGCSLAGPLAVCFISFVIEQIRKNIPDCLFFIARDGYLLHKVFPLFSSHEIPSYYIYASRGLIDNINRGIVLKENYKKYISSTIGESKKIENVLLVDTTTINFTAQKFISEMFPGAKISAVYWLANAGNTNFNYASCYVRPHPIEKINFLIETLLSAPTPPVNLILGSKPVFSNKNNHEAERCKIYADIMDGALTFCHYAISNSAIRNFSVFFDHVVIEDILTSFVNNYTQFDYEQFSRLSHTGDLYNADSKALTLYLDRFKKSSITVIICVYNGEKFLDQCLSSVLRQTLKNIEVICVDDCSTDGSYQILEKYQQADGRVKIIRNSKNSGLATSRNKALSVARGEYIQFVDADDYITPECCETLYKRCKELKLDMLTFSGFNFDSNNNKIANNYWNFNPFPQKWNKTWFTYKDCKDFISEIHVSSCLTLYRRAFLAENKIKFPDGLFFEDNYFFTKAIFNAKRASIHKGKFYARRVHAESITQNWDKHFSDYIKIISMVLNFLHECKIGNEIIEQYKSRYSQNVRYFYSRFSAEAKKKYFHSVADFYKKFGIQED